MSHARTRRTTVAATATIGLLGAAFAPAMPVDPAWDVVLVTPGATSVDLASDGDERVYAQVVSEPVAGAPVARLLRSLDAGATFTELGLPTPLGDAEVTANGAELLVRDVDTALVSDDGGDELRAPDYLQDSMVQLDRDGGMWWSPHSFDQCAGDTGFRTSPTTRGPESFNVRIPAGHEVTPSFAPGRGQLAVAVFSSCDSGRQTLWSTGNDGQTWREIGRVSTQSLTEPTDTTAMAWTDADEAVVEGTNNTVRVLSAFGGHAKPRIVTYVIPRVQNLLGRGVASEIVSIAAAGQVVTITTGSGTVFLTEVADGELGPLQLLRTSTSGVQPDATVLRDGTVLARFEPEAVERRSPQP